MFPSVSQSEMVHATLPASIHSSDAALEVSHWEKGKMMAMMGVCAHIECNAARGNSNFRG